MGLGKAHSLLGLGVTNEFYVIDGLVSGLPLDLKSEGLDLDLNWVIVDFCPVLEAGEQQQHL